MKRMIVLLLVLGVILSSGVPALAVTESATDAELTAVTERVVGLLDVSDDYTDFTGSYDSGPVSSWYLSWSKQGEDLSVRATPEGLITSVSIWIAGDSTDRFYGYDPAFPGFDETEACSQAEGWLEKLVDEKEDYRIDDTMVPLSAGGEYMFSGRILKNGLESPVTFYIWIGEAGMTSFSRSDSYRGYVGELPAAKAETEAQQAAQILKGSAAFELYYVTDGDEARLRYVPVGPTITVDAQTGKATDMNALYDSFNGWYGTESPMAQENMMAVSEDAAMGTARGLTEVELSSISNYADAMTEETLDERMRSIGELGLADFTFSRCSYRMDTDGKITASLRYTCEMTEDRLFGYSKEEYREEIGWGETPMVFKYISADAKTGDLISVSTSYSLWEKDRIPSTDTGAAEAFLKKAAPVWFAESSLCTLRGYDDPDGATYARVHDGYFFPENYLYIAMNNATNTVDTYYYCWDEETAFAPSGDIVSEKEALDAYTDALTVTLGYTAWPEDIDYDDPIQFAYADWGYSYVESLRLAYYYSGKDEVAGVDALTGEPVRQDPDGGYLYDDLEGVPERTEIEALAQSGIGLPGSSFGPDSLLTMRDAVRLLLSSAGCRADDWDDEELAGEAVWYGFIPAEEWDPDGILQESEFITMILGASRYGDAARLEGIGFPTVSEALGMTEGAFSDEICTRAGAARLLYLFMKR